MSETTSTWLDRALLSLAEVESPEELRAWRIEHRTLDVDPADACAVLEPLVLETQARVTAFCTDTAERLVWLRSIWCPMRKNVPESITQHPWSIEFDGAWHNVVTNGRALVCIEGLPAFERGGKRVAKQIVPLLRKRGVAHRVPFEALKRFAGPIEKESCETCHGSGKDRDGDDDCWNCSSLGFSYAKRNGRILDTFVSRVLVAYALEGIEEPGEVSIETPEPMMLAFSGTGWRVVVMGLRCPDGPDPVVTLEVPS